MRFHPQPPDALVVGAGPVGLFSALMLARKHIPVRIIDKAPGPGVYSYALALHPSTLDLFDRFGLTSSLLRFASLMQRIGIYSGHRRVGELDLTQTSANHPYVAVIPQSALESILLEALAREGVVVEWNHRLASLHLEPDEVTGTIEKRAQRMMGYATAHMEWMVDDVRNFHVPYLIAADGFNSICRHLVQIPFPRTGEPMDFSVFEIETREPIEPEIRIVLSGDKLNVCWPIGSHRCRWSFQCDPRPDPVDEREKEREYVQLGEDQYPILESSHLHEFLSARAPFFTQTVQRIDWRMVVRFERGLADYFHEGNLCLLGDSAHVCSPVGVQSMNRGLLEANHLTQVLARILRDGSTHETLESWSLATRQSWTRQLEIAETEGLGGDSEPELAAHASNLVFGIPASGPDLRDLLGKLGFALPPAHQTVAAT